MIPETQQPPASERQDSPVESASIVLAQAFAAVDEPGAEALLGTAENALLPMNGDAIVYGDGGAGKTTLMVDMACHLAAGDPWLGIPVPRRARVLLVENEGPRPQFRMKLRRKLESWSGSAIGDHLLVWEHPWGDFSFRDDGWQQALAETIREREIDVVIVGPVTRAGMDEAGTIQEVRDFMKCLNEVRRVAARAVTFPLIHHENKGGQVSGAWEGAADTTLHVQGRGHGRMCLLVQKARWASGYHAKSFNLLWTEGEGYEVEEKPELDDETLADLILEYVAENPGTSWKRVEEATPGKRAEVRRAVRDRLLAGAQLLNVVKEGGLEVALNHCPERRPSRLYVADDAVISHLRPDPDAVGTQLRPPGVRDGTASSASCVPPLKDAGRRDAVAHPLPEASEEGKP